VVIGLFGLSSSFGALVLARRREFGVLRHIGMMRRQIGSMLAAQGLLVSALGLAETAAPRLGAPADTRPARGRRRGRRRAPARARTSPVLPHRAYGLPAH